MKITIEVPDEQGPALVEWLGGIKKPSKTAKQEVSIVISTEVKKDRPKRTSWMDTNALRIPLLAITHDYVRQFEVKDVVENTKSGNWGGASAHTFRDHYFRYGQQDDSCVAEMEFHESETALLV